MTAAELAAIAARAARRLTLDVRATAAGAAERTIGWQAFEAAATKRIGEAVAETLRVVAEHAREQERQERTNQ